MSDNFEDAIRDSIEPWEFLDKPDIHQHLTDFEPIWLKLWDAAPVEDMTPGMIDAMIDMVLDIDADEMSLEELLETWIDNFWEWYNETYSDT